MDKECLTVMEADWVPETDEDLIRDHKALVYSTKVYLRQQRLERKVDRIVQASFTVAVILWAVVAVLALWAKCLL